MATPVRLSPGVYVNEFDFSSYASQLGLTTLCVLGGATKGPLNTPLLCTSEPDLVSKFGSPLITDYALQAAVQVLRGGGQVLFNRIAHDGYQSALATIAGTSGGTPAGVAIGTITFTGQPADADYLKVRKSTPIVALENDVAGAAGNTSVATSDSAVIVVSGMTGGIGLIKSAGSIQFKNAVNPTQTDTVSIDDGTGVSQPVVFEFTNTTPSGAHIAVAIGADAYITAQNLVNAINSIIGGLKVTATNATVEKIFEFDSNGSFTAGRIPVAIGGTSAITMSNLISALRNNSVALSITTQDTSSNNPQVTITTLLGGLGSNAPIAKSSGGSSANITLVGLTGGTAAIAGSTVTGFTATATSPGTWGKELTVEVLASTELGAGPNDFDLIVVGPLDDFGTLGAVEKFNRLNLTEGDPRSVDNVTLNGILGEVAPSKYVLTEIIVSGALVTPGTYSCTATGDDPTVNGLNLVAADYIGSVIGQTATGFKAINNPESTEFNLLAVPGVSNAAVINELIATCNKRFDCFGLIDPPFGLGVDDIIAWHNGVSFIVPNAPTQALDTNRCALYWGWQQAYDSYNTQNLWLPPSGFVAAAMATSDAANGQWAAVAGLNRGLLQGSLACEYSPFQDDRDKLQGGANHVNPIVNFQHVGPTIYGNRTLQRAKTALDSVHTRRMLTYVEKIITLAVAYIVFDPNDPITWQKFIQTVTPVLDTVKSGRGLEDYRVICDTTTNPAEQIRRKTMKGKILIKALDVAEIIEQDFALFATGADFNENF